MTDDDKAEQAEEQAAAAAPPHDTPSSRDAIAATAVQLALSFPTWVRRRKWTFTYIDDTTIRQQLSVCFRIPDSSALPLAQGHKTLLVPLWIPKKVPLTNVDALDEEGRALSIMSKQENGELAARGLFWIFKGLAPEGAQLAVTDAQLLDALRAITTAQPTDANHRSTISQAKQTVAMLAVFESDDERAALIEDLAGGFLLLVPVAFEPGRDRIIKLAFDTPHFWHGTGPGTAKERWNSALASLGLRDKQQFIPQIQIGWSLSTHVQVSAPPEVELGEAWLDVEQFDPASGDVSRVSRRHVVYDRPNAELNVSVLPEWDFAEPQQPLDEDDPADPAVEAHRNLMSCRGDLADLQLRLTPSVRGVIVAAAVLSVLTTLLLWMASTRLARLDGQTSAALLLALPAALAAYLARPGEHAFAARLLTGVRLAALAVGVCSLLLAALIAAGATRQDVSSPSATFKDVSCRTSNAFSGRRSPRVPRLRELTCSGQVAQMSAPEPKTTSTAQTIAYGSSGLATVLALLLVWGFARTFRADCLRRNRPDEFA